jgi:hypothetical protein
LQPLSADIACRTALGDLTVLEQCVDQRHFRRHHDGCEAHRLHNGITGITSSATTVPRTMDNGIPIANNRTVIWPRRTTDGRSSIAAWLNRDHGQRQLGQEW